MLDAIANGFDAIGRLLLVSLHMVYYAVAGIVAIAIIAGSVALAVRVKRLRRPIVKLIAFIARIYRRSV